MPEFEFNGGADGDQGRPSKPAVSLIGKVNNVPRKYLRVCGFCSEWDSSLCPGTERPPSSDICREWIS